MDNGSNMHMLDEFTPFSLDPKVTGEIISGLMKEQGLNDQMLSTALGITNEAVYKWRTGRSMPSSDNIANLAVIFGVPVECLLGMSPRIYFFCKRCMNGPAFVKDEQEYKRLQMMNRMLVYSMRLAKLYKAS